MSVFDKIAKAQPTGPTVWMEPDGTWWWADETWAPNGPCKTYEEAVAAQNKYCREELGL